MDVLATLQLIEKYSLIAMGISIMIFSIRLYNSGFYAPSAFFIGISGFFAFLWKFIFLAYGEASLSKTLSEIFEGSFGIFLALGALFYISYHHTEYSKKLEGALEALKEPERKRVDEALLESEKRLTMSDYQLGIKELDEAVSIKQGSNIMLIGPPISGKEVILNHIVYHGATKNENAIITVTTRESAAHILEWFKENKLTLPMSRIGIVDCITKTLGDTAVDSENIKIANSPADLTEIGVKISQFFEEFLTKKNTQKIQLHIKSLSTILMYSNIQTVFRFLHVFTGRIKAAGALGIYVVESGMHDERAIATLKQLFDGMIEIKSEDDKNLIRVVGPSPKPTPWFEYEIVGADVKILWGK